MRIDGGQALIDGAVGRSDIAIRRSAAGSIADVGADGRQRPPPSMRAGSMVLPGIVDIHGDAFERQMMPRPGVAFPSTSR